MFFYENFILLCFSTVQKKKQKMLNTMCLKNQTPVIILVQTLYNSVVISDFQHERLYSVTY